MTIFEEYSVEIIKLILSMSFTGSIMSVVLFILKSLIKDKLPKSFLYYMWLSVVIALILPVSKIIMIPVSNHLVMPLNLMFDVVQWISDITSENLINPVFVPQNRDIQNISPITCFSNTAIILFIFWLLGMLLFLGFNIICYVSYIRKLNKCNISANWRETTLLNNLLKGKSSLQLYKNSIVEIPILIGAFRPAIILPDKKYEDMKLRNILMHEIVHMKKHDIFVKWLLIFIGSIHWFNPFIYLVRREMNKACELACDESVIKRFDINEKQLYGDTLIAVAADSIRKMPISITMFEDKKNLKERLDAIMKHKKYSKRTVIMASAILATIVCTIFLGSTLQSIENKHNYADNYPLPQDQKNIKEIELRNALRDYDKKIDEAYVFLSDLNGEITNAYINIVCQERNPDSEMQNGIKFLASEELGLDIQNIYVDYIDFDLDTSK